MRELAVYYCTKCGRYGYYQLVRNAVCANCDRKMSLLDMPYIQFIHLDRQQRDELLTKAILTYSQSITDRIIRADLQHNTRNIVAQLQERILDLEAENKKLNETVDWMHQTIWDLLDSKKKLEQQLEQATHPQQPD
ncbi:MAG: hypothetical protein ACRDBO_02960 [Lachnospiraceae bacterium]